MSIAATANSSYNISLATGAASLATSASSLAASAAASTNGRIATIVEALTRVLQTANASMSTTAAASANSSAAIILTQMLTLAKESAAPNTAGSTNGAVLMELNLNQLLNSSTLQKVLSQLPPELLSKPQVIEALVLQNTLLPATPDKAQSTLPLLILPTPAGTSASAQNTGANNSANTLYRVNIEWQNKLIQLLSAQPLPAGTRVPLQIDAHGAITLLRPEVAAKILLAQNIARNAATANVSPSAQTAPVNSAALPPLTPTQTIQQSLRELLPRQQALHTLVPLLQKFIAPAIREKLPQPVTEALAQLLQSLPKPTQLNTAENVKQAIHNSGSFLEAKIANAAIAAPDAEPLPKIAATDIKAQITALLALVRQFTPHATAATKTAATQTSTQFVAEDEFVYTKPAIQNLAGDNTQSGESESLDNLLAQLGKLLQSGFARIQLNQLDSANARHINHESQIPVPTWVLELPLRTQHGVDQLQLRIEQHRKQQQQRTHVQWNVEIAFDLHAAGKIAASLAIVDNSVSATLWAEQEKTHVRVREEMTYLRAGLESVGVKVTEMQCRLGLPVPRANPISQQLVDVHT